LFDRIQYVNATVCTYVCVRVCVCNRIKIDVREREKE
jgi:hypothetical protein